VLAKCQREVTVLKLGRFLSRALPLLIVVAMMPPPMPAAAWASLPTLNGEVFTGSATVTSPPCLDPANGTFMFNASGTATGAYPGPFSEMGSVTISPTLPLPTVTGFHVDPMHPFTITANSGPQAGDTVTGTKDWAPPAGFFGACSLEAIALSINSTYSAIITIPSTGERFCDTGMAITNFGNGAPGEFDETFTSNRAVATPTPTGACP
jgi:hypothetical protein